MNKKSIFCPKYSRPFQNKNLIYYAILDVLITVRARKVESWKNNFKQIKQSYGIIFFKRYNPELSHRNAIVCSFDTGFFLWIELQLLAVLWTTNKLRNFIFTKNQKKTCHIICLIGGFLKVSTMIALDQTHQ